MGSIYLYNHFRKGKFVSVNRFRKLDYASYVKFIVEFICFALQLRK